MILIGVTGKKRSGKDTLFHVLQEGLTDRRVIRLAFADALKEEVSEACGVPVMEMEAKKALYGPMFQWWGTEFRREQFGKNYWIDRMHAKVTALRDEEAAMELPFMEQTEWVVVVTDARFVNELEYVKSQGGVTVRVLRPVVEGDMDRRSMTHASELDGASVRCDFEIVNDGTVEDYRGKVMRAAWEIPRLLTPTLSSDEEEREKNSQ